MSAPQGWPCAAISVAFSSCSATSILPPPFRSPSVLRIPFLPAIHIARCIQVVSLSFLRHVGHLVLDIDTDPEWFLPDVHQVGLRWADLKRLLDLLTALVLSCRLTLHPQTLTPFQRGLFKNAQLRVHSSAVSPSPLPLADPKVSRSRLDHYKALVRFQNQPQSLQSTARSPGCDLSD